VHGIDRRHVDDQATPHLSLTESAVSLTARGDVDAVSCAEMHHFLDVSDGAGKQDRYRRLVDDVARVDGVWRERRRIRDDPSIELGNTSESGAAAVTTPSPRFCVESKHDRGANTHNNLTSG
jgi:hypothetical protein